MLTLQLRVKPHLALVKLLYLKEVWPTKWAAKNLPPPHPIEHK